MNCFISMFYVTLMYYFVKQSIIVYRHKLQYACCFFLSPYKPFSQFATHTTNYSTALVFVDFNNDFCKETVDSLLRHCTLLHLLLLNGFIHNFIIEIFNPYTSLQILSSTQTIKTIISNITNTHIYYKHWYIVKWATVQLLYNVTNI